jgi:hypothetical protein
MHLRKDRPPDETNPVDAARVAIWRLFQEGYVDENMATAVLLAVDLGTRRFQRKEQHPGNNPSVSIRPGLRTHAAV